MKCTKNFLLGVAAFVYCVCVRRRKPVAAPHLPIGGENEDEWEEIAFERVESVSTEASGTIRVKPWLNTWDTRRDI